MAQYVPKEAWLWKGEDCISDGGTIIPGYDQDIVQVNVAVDLRGNFSDKRFELILTDNNDPTRVFRSLSNDLPINGFYVGFLSFEYDKFHVKTTESYKIELCVNDDTGISFGMIGDWQPNINEISKTQQPPGPRVEFYGVRNGIQFS
ncbi:MAG: hypothetical protein GY718_04450 [Lentisphaerae bacterium]|nr:hypothetical protein [Lentisphaerota bacterium]